MSMLYELVSTLLLTSKCNQFIYVPASPKILI